MLIRLKFVLIVLLSIGIIGGDGSVYSQSTGNSSTSSTTSSEELTTGQLVGILAVIVLLIWVGQKAAKSPHQKNLRKDLKSINQFMINPDTAFAYRWKVSSFIKSGVNNYNEANRVMGKDIKLQQEYSVLNTHRVNFNEQVSRYYKEQFDYGKYELLENLHRNEIGKADSIYVSQLTKLYYDWKSLLVGMDVPVDKEFQTLSKIISRFKTVVNNEVELSAWIEKNKTLKEFK
jgi:hypothetical protein